MAKESFRNMRAVCSTHAPSPDPKLIKMKPEKFIGHFIKYGFRTFNHVGDGSTEHMWVKVKAVKDGMLEGELNNDPVFHAYNTEDKKPLKCGDTVQVHIEGIEEVLWDGL